MEAVELEIIMRDKTRQGMESAKENVGSIDETIIRQQALITSLENDLQQLQVAYAKASEKGLDNSESVAQVNTLKQQIEALSAELATYQTQATQTNNTPLHTDLDKTKTKFNTLSFSVQQVARELPTLAMGPQMFFLAISNNLPMLTDEIKRTAAANKLLNESGQKGTPVWKQLLGSIFSWQTAMVVGITLLVTYGKEIGNWVSGLFNAGDALDQNIEKLEEFQKKVSESMGKSIASVNKLAADYSLLGDSMDAKKRFIEENKSAFNSLGVAVNSVVDAENLLINNKAEFIDSLIFRANATAAMELAGAKYLQMQEKIRLASTLPSTVEKVTHTGNDGFQRVEVQNPERVDLLKEAAYLRKEGDAMIEAYKMYSEDSGEILKGIGIETQEIIVEGSVAAIEKSISEKQKALKKLTNKADYDAAVVEIKAEEKKLEAIIGNKSDAPKKVENNIGNFLFEAEKKLQEQKIALMKDGAEKEKEIRLQKYNDEIKRIDNTEAALLKHYAELKKNGVKVNPNDVVNVQNHFSKQRENEGIIYNNQVKTIDDDTIEKERIIKEKAWNELLREFETYQQKRERIAKEYNDKIVQLTSNGASDAIIAQAQKQKVTALAELDNATKSSTSVMTRLFDDMSHKGVMDMRAIADEAQRLYDYLRDTPDSDIMSGFGMSAEQLKALKASPADLEAIAKAILKVRNNADEAETLFKRMGTSLKNIFSGTLTPDKFGEELQRLNSDFQAVSTIINMFGDSLRNIGELSGSDIFGDIADGLSNVLDIANQAISGATAGFAVGGPVGAAIGAGIGILSSITGIFAKAKQHREVLKKELQESQMESYLGELEVNALYRERYQWAQKIGESTTKNLKRQADEIKKQTSDNAKEQEDIFRKLSTSEYKESETYRHGTMFRKAKIITEWGSLAGKEWKEIELLAAQGKLSEEGQKYYEALKKAKEEGADLAERQIEMLETAKEFYTGTTVESVAQGIVDGFLEGKRTAADFADSFEDMMRDSMIDALTDAMTEDVTKWRNEYYALAGDADGLTAKDIEYLRQKYNDIIAKQREQADKMEEVTGIDFSQGAKQNAQNGAFTTMTQDQGTKLEGMFTAVQINTSEINDKCGEMILTLFDALDSLHTIADNTAHCKRLKEIEEILEEIRKNGIKMK